MKRCEMITGVLAFMVVMLWTSCVPHRPSPAVSIQTTRLELPKKSNSEMVIVHSSYTVSFNVQTHIPNWVAYELTAEETDGPWSRKGLRFMPDPECPFQQANHDDYRNSGYSRGHLAPAGDMKWDSVAMMESFYFTNCIPQDEKLNNGKWNQLEIKIRSLAQRYGRVFVVTGPAFLCSDTLRIGMNNVAVPDACFKALLIPRGDSYSAIAFLMNNSGENRELKDCSCSVDSLERVLSMDFFYELPDTIEPLVESAVIWNDWGF